ncbi:MAG: hypothetical protein N3A01_08015 [Bacteroidales bacterium]|nr:hypothetical protein [Bacteroidales bacterium]
MTKTDILNLIQFNALSSEVLLFNDGNIIKNFTIKNQEKFASLICAAINSSCKKILLGIKTKKHRASEINYIEFSEDIIPHLKTIIETSIFPTPREFQIDFIEITHKKGVILINLKNPIKPCMTFDGRYYFLRNNYPTIMKEYEIRNLYLTQSKPSLELVGIINTQGIPIYENGELTSLTFYPKILIKNSGTAPEQLYKIEIKIPSQIHDTNNSPLQNYFTGIDGKYSVFTVLSKYPIFQDEIYTICEMKIFATKNNIKTFFTDFLYISIFYSVQKNSYQYLLSELLHFNKQPLNENLFLKT